MTNQSEGPAVEKARCERCGIAKPEHTNHLWACCGDGPGYGDQIKPETVACLRRQLEAAHAELAIEREGRRHLEEAAELLKRRPTIIDGVLDLYDWMDEVEEWKKRDQSSTPAEAPSAEEPARGRGVRPDEVTATGGVVKPATVASNICTYGDCRKVATTARGYCAGHWEQKRLDANAAGAEPEEPPPSRKLRGG